MTTDARDARGRARDADKRAAEAGGRGAHASTWDELPAYLRSALEGRLAGLYGAPDDAQAFGALAEDKRRALLVFARRLRELDLWDSVRRVTNVYGEGGVGIAFAADPRLSRRLRASRRFTSRFAAHGDTAEGFFEMGQRRASLHFLRAARGADEWAAHFDLHSPVGDPLSALRHLWRERWRGRAPRWEEIAAVLGYD
ncbi:MAG: hypothetical protein LC746_02750 [Acidobacteria bacterium]|nr:hypothetical protein [Acidobacteriota bacterium]